ncbi:MAG: TetR/AcrR family transcriptional regulator [Deltaproteobacteria bacterium]|nr:TetR/AcrR family transcriptional regulator [Deltaproteobacteria bacterium]
MAVRTKKPKTSRRLRAAAVVDEDLHLSTTREVPVVTRKTFMAIGERMITERGFARTRVEDLAAAAGVPPAMFHAHFAGKGALLRALNDEFVEQMVGAIDAATRAGSWRNARVRDVVEIAVRAILDVVLTREGLVRAFLSHGATDRSLALGLSKIGSHMTRRLMKSLAECVDAPEQSAVRERHVGFSLLLSVGLAHHCVLVGEGWSGVPFTREELVEEMARNITAYLQASHTS